MECRKRVLAALTILGLCAQTAPGFAAAVSDDQQTAKRSGNKSEPSPKAQLQGDERILHALNRFTFGPRPEDVEAVRAMGLEKWFESQLHPESIKESLLNDHLAQFPAVMSLNTEQLLQRFPSDPMVRLTENGKLPMPDNTIVRAIYADQLIRLKDKLLKKEATTQAAPSGAMPDASQRLTPAAKINASRTTKSNDSAPLITDNAQLTMSPSAIPATDASAMPPGTEPMTPATASDLTNQDVEAAKTKSASQLAHLIAENPHQRLHDLISMKPEEFDAIRQQIKGPDRFKLITGLTPDEQEIAIALLDSRIVVPDELAEQRVIRDIYSSAQLDEVMTDFWLNHFNVYLRKNPEMPYYLVSFERDVIRPHALGKFEDMLEATAHSPAMLLYLDNVNSIGPESLAATRARSRSEANSKQSLSGLNENYARELMELHTVGVNGGYTQADVTQVARILTGWSVDHPQVGGDFKFEERRHEPGTKVVMGKSFNEAGEQEGRDLLHMLATRPATAAFLSRKLAIRFVGDDPPQSLLDRMTKSYLTSDGDISQVLRTLFHSPEFWSPDAYRAKVKTPLEYVVSTVRASGIPVTRARPLVNAIQEMGMPLYGSVPPTGYSWQSNAWVSAGALVSRMNFALTLAGNKYPGLSRNWAAPVDPWVAQTPVLVIPADEEQRLETQLIVGGVSASTRNSILLQLVPTKLNPSQLVPTAQPVASHSSSADSSPPAQVVTASAQTKISPDQLEQKDELLAGLLLGSPEFQRR